MATVESDPKQIIRVVMFGSGPELTHDARQFLYLLEMHPEIQLLAAVCQSKSQSVRAIFMDLWRRRGVLAVPLFIARFLAIINRYLQNPKQHLKMKKSLDEISSRLHFVENIHSQDVLNFVRSLEPDLGLIYGSPILKPELFTIPRLGTLGIHHGMVPEYRGNKTTFWAMFNGEAFAGVTIQKINEGLDTGEIVKEGKLPVGRLKYGQVVKKLEKLGLELYLQTIIEVKNGTAVFKPQPAFKGKLYRNPKPSDFMKFWIKQIRRRFGS